MECIEPALHGCGRRGNRERGQHDDRGVTEREEETHRVGRLALLHQFSDDVVDGGDMVGIEGVPKAEDVSQKGRAEQRRPVHECDPCPQPRRRVGRDEQSVNARCLGSQPMHTIIKKAENHLSLPPCKFSCWHKVTDLAIGRREGEPLGTRGSRVAMWVRRPAAPALARRAGGE